MNKTSGIYIIINILNNKIYIGSAINLYKRLYEHFRTLKENKHKNKHLQSSYNKYKKDNFIYHLLEYCNKEELIKREQYYINLLKPEYNICQIAGNSLGLK